MGISKAQSAIYDEIKKTEAFLLRGEICLSDAVEHLYNTINSAYNKYVYCCGYDEIDLQAAYHKAFVMLARVTKRK